MQNIQMELGEIDVSHIKFDLRSDHQMTSRNEMVNQHKTLRAMLGHSLYDEDKKYAYQTLVDNVSLLTPELLDKLNQLIVEGGHVLVKKSESALRGRCGSFVVETYVHFPTDLNLLEDAMCQAITLTARWCESQQLSDWRQYRYNLYQLKRLMHHAQNKKRSKAKTEAHRNKIHAQMIQAHQVYIDQAQRHLDKIQTTLTRLLATAPGEQLQQLQLKATSNMPSAKLIKSNVASSKAKPFLTQKKDSMSPIN